MHHRIESGRGSLIRESRMAQAKSTVWTRFKRRYPCANFSKFRTENFFGRQNVMLQAENGDEIAVFNDDTGGLKPSLYFSDKMKQALRITAGFPLELTLNLAPKLPEPAVPFTDTPIHWESDRPSYRSLPHPPTILQYRCVTSSRTCKSKTTEQTNHIGG